MKISFLLILFLMSSTFAQGTSNQSYTFPNKIVREPVLPKLDNISFFSVFTGPSIGNLRDPVDESGELDKDSINTWNQISFQWKLTNRINFVLNPRFIVNHNTQERDLEFDTPVFGLAGKWYENGKFTFSGGVNSMLPFIRDEGNTEDGLALNPGGFNSISYKLSDTLRVGSWIWARFFFYDKATNNKEDRASFFIAPQVNLILSDKTSVTAFYQINGNSNNNSKVIVEEDDSLNLMYSYSINKSVTIEPMITVFSGSNFQPAKGNINVWISGRLF